MATDYEREYGPRQEMPDDGLPRPGQRWADRDPRNEGRTVEVLHADEHYITVQTRTASIYAAQPMSAVFGHGRQSRIRTKHFLRRFHPRLEET